MNMSVQDFWQAQPVSLHRAHAGESHRAKAWDLFTFMRPEDRSGPLADFACGDGEILRALCDLSTVAEAGDLSAPSLMRARAILPETVATFQEDGLTLGAHASAPVWITTAGLNQYLPEEALGQWIRLFARLRSTRSLYLFDCIDPHRYLELSAHSSYDGSVQTLKQRLKVRSRAAATKLRNIGSRSCVDLGDPRMGFAYFPGYFRRMASRYELNIEIASSRQYEYRYHVQLVKPWQQSTPLPGAAAHCADVTP